MSDLFHPALQGPNGALPRRRGRPPGAKSRRSLDLAKYVEAHFAGMTPGQQLAELGMVTAKEVREAGSVQAALGRRAVAMAAELRCTALEAMVVLVKAQTELMPYVHQKRPIAADQAGQALPTMFVVAEADLLASAAGAAQTVADVDLIEDFGQRSTEVAHDKSHEDT